MPNTLPTKVTTKVTTKSWPLKPLGRGNSTACSAASTPRWRITPPEMALTLATLPLLTCAVTMPTGCGARPLQRSARSSATPVKTAKPSQ